ncbi:hypothetical protein BS47DRAFT_1353055 [Hydnum rufescens UP504]|uniref:Uncharacterized protein n=1 Tax=Hydnum rufescens UP504 TaxID=1448309 RepID=A0A9P6AHW3_9AGAM|nr:hypothetical protein BS47DRAFT_1353055 [Hydnum rufescens UP504]
MHCQLNRSHICFSWESYQTRFTVPGVDPQIRAGIGAVHTVQMYYRTRTPSQEEWDWYFILVGLENSRRIENWLK